MLEIQKSLSSRWYSYAAIIALLFVVLLTYGCGSTSQDDFLTPTIPQSQATITPIDFSWETATPSPEPTSFQNQSSTLPLESKLYLHPQNIFAIRPPKGWTIEEQDYSTTFLAPELNSRIDVAITNTGFQIEAGAFERYVIAREKLFFSDFEEYKKINETIEPEKRTAIIQKSLMNAGITQVVESYYLQRGGLIGSIDIWASEDLLSTYHRSFERIQSEFIVNSKVDSTEIPIYAPSYTYSCPEDLCTFEVPNAWTLQASEGDFTEVHTISSPDDQAYIQLAIYDDGEEISDSVAGNFALHLLRTYYASDIEVTADTFLADGRERLDWSSPAGNYSGSSAFGTRGTTFIIFSVMKYDDYQDTYSEILQRVFDSYSIP